MDEPQPSLWSPGPITGAIVGVEAAGLLLSDSRHFFAGTALFFAIGGLIALAWFALFLWILSETRFRMRPREWARWLAIPIAAILCLALVISDTPFRLRFELSRGALDQAAAVGARGGDLPSHTYVGLLPVGESWSRDGVTYFDNPDNGLISWCGVAHLQEGAKPTGLLLGRNYGGGWREACIPISD
jgi:hypothetical protein